MSFLLTCIKTIGSWISGTPFQSVINLFIEGVSVLSKFISSIMGIKLLIVLAIAVVTAAVIASIVQAYKKSQEEFKDVKFVGMDRLREKLNKNNGDAAKIHNKCYTFKQNVKSKVNNFINDKKVEDSKKENLDTFINVIISLISESNKGGENECTDTFNLNEKKEILFKFKNDKQKNVISLTFSYDDNIIFEFLSLLLELLKKENYKLMKNYEAEFKNYYVNDIEPMKIIIIEVRK